MSWIHERPHDATEQLLEYAETGRLIALDPRTRIEARDKASIVIVMVFSAITVGAGMSLVISAMRGFSTVEVTVGLGLVALGLSLLLPALRIVHQHTASHGVEIQPGAVLPPQLVRSGNWIYREGAWTRIDQVGHDGAGKLTALLSTGEVIDLLNPITIAGGSFRPTSDPVSSLRR